MANLTSWFILFYGFAAAYTYENVSNASKGFPLFSLPLFCVLALMVLIPFSNFNGIKKEFSGKTIIRPLLLTISQLLIIGSLSFGTPFSIFASTAAGTLCSTILGKFFLGEKIKRISAAGILLTITGVYFIKKTNDLPALAILAGIIQGSAVFLARKRSTSGARPVEMASASIILLFLASIPCSYFLTPDHLSFSAINIQSSMIAGLGFAFLQFSYCFLSGKIDAWMLSLIGNTRIPASVFITSFSSNQEISWFNLGLGLMIMSGIVIAYKGMQSSNNTPKLKDQYD
jgi:drug/metabolite transporter (DMT)-like permease